VADMEAHRRASEDERGRRVAEKELRSAIKSGLLWPVNEGRLREALSAAIAAGVPGERLQSARNLLEHSSHGGAVDSSGQNCTETPSEVLAKVARDRSALSARRAQVAREETQQAFVRQHTKQVEVAEQTHSKLSMAAEGVTGAMAEDPQAERTHVKKPGESRRQCRVHRWVQASLPPSHDETIGLRSERDAAIERAFEAEQRAVEAERSTEQMRHALSIKADEVETLRASLSSARQPGSGVVGEPAWKSRVRALEQQLAQACALIAQLRAHVP